MTRTFSWFDYAHHKLNAKVLQFFFLATGLFMAAAVFAQTAASDIPKDLLPVAQELGCNTKAACETAFNGNLTKGIEIAERYKIYDKNPEIKKLASTFRQEVLSKLASVTEGNFEETIVKIAKDLIEKQPSLAKQLSVTSQEVTAADTIVKEVKKQGVDLSICRQSADSLTREQLVACLNATKNLAEQKDTVKTYISDKRIEASASNDSTLKLNEAIAKGEYSQLGAKNAEELGVICLRPGSPATCDEIASRFFGSEGVKMLTQARQQVTSVENKYRNVSDSFTLTTPDGKTVTGKDAIRSECDRAFSTRNINLARACGQFAVKNGFATDVEVQDGLKFMQSIQGQGNADLNQCRTNPQGCEQYIPQQNKSDFAAFQQVGEIMKTEIGFDPSQCQQGSSNSQIGQKCFEGSKSALPKLEELVKTSPAVQSIVNDIKKNISDSQKFEDKRADIQKTFQSQQGGPGGCKSADECFKYCSDAAHGLECISFGAKQGVFSGNEAVSRFQEYNQRLENPSFYAPYGSQQGQPSQQGQQQQGQQQGQGAPGNQGQQGQFQGPNQGQVPPGQTPGFTQPGPGFGPPPGQSGQSGFGGGNFGGPSPECFAAIQSGDFVKAKTLCAPPTSAGSYPGQFQGQPQGQYPQGQYQGQYPGQQPTSQSYLPQQVTTNPPSPTNVQPGQQPTSRICPALPTVSSCRTGERRVVSFSSPECGTYYKCEPETGTTQPPYPQPYPQPYTGPSAQCDWSREYMKVSTNTCMPRTNCNDTANAEYNTSECQGVRGSTSNLNQPSSQSCSAGQYWNGSSCITSGQASGQRQMTWNSLGLSSQIRNDADTARIEQLKQACVNVQPSPSIWMPSAGDYASSDFGMPNPDKCRQAASCSAGQYWNGSACVTGSAGTGTSAGGNAGYSQCSASLTGLLGSGCHSMYTDSSGRQVFCDGPMSKSAKEGDTVTTSGCSGGADNTSACTAGQYWNGSACVSSGSTTCSSGQYWNGTSCVTSTYPSGGTGSQCTSAEVSALGDGCHYMNGTTPFNGAMTAYYQGGSIVQCSTTSISGCPGSSISSGGCPAGQYWSNGACATGTPPPSCSSGQYWNGSSCVASGSTTCPSGQYWNGSSCTSSGGPTACPSGQYWNGTSCVSSTTTTCPSGQYWNNGACVATSPTDCPSGQYWNGTSCVTSPPSVTDPATGCAQAGGLWNGSTCQMPSSTTPPTSLIQTKSILANIQAVLEQLLRTLSR